MLNRKNSILIGIDLQEKLVNMLGKNAETITENAVKIIRAAKILDIETVLTEQYPKGLGKTIEPVLDVLGAGFKCCEKTSFSCVKSSEVLGKIKNSGKRQVVLFGIEAHICVYQTALELKERGYEVFIAENVSFSRNSKEKETALTNLRDNGISVLTLEMILFSWLESSKTAGFKEIQNLIK